MGLAMTHLLKSLFAVCLFLSATLSVANAADYIPFRLLDTRDTKLQTPTNQVIRSQAQWLAFYQNATSDSSAIVPVVDFSKRQVVVIAAGSRPSSGYSVVVSGVYKSADCGRQWLFHETWWHLYDGISHHLSAAFLINTKNSKAF